MMFRSIQVFRGLAACAVVVVHAYFQAGPGTVKAVALGSAGVDLFFVISGFIMATIAKRPSFLFDRFWRIYPLWFVALLPWWYFHRHMLGWPTVAASLTLWPVYDRFTAPTLALGWTLSFEMLFYVSLALSLKVGARVPLALFAVCLMGGILTDAPLFDFLGNPMIFEFLLGVVIAKLPKDENWAWPLLLIGVAVFAASPQMIAELDVRLADAVWLRPLFWGIPAAFLVYSALSYERLFQSTAWNIPVLLGNASFSIYLFHLLFVRKFHAPWPVVLVVAVVASVVMWWTVERRILAMKPRLGRKHSELVGAPKFSIVKK